MLSFVLVSSRDGAPLPPPLASHLAGPGAAAWLAFEPDRSHTWTSGAGAVIVRAWERDHPALGLGPHWRQRGDRLTLFAGLPVPRGQVPAGRWADHLAGLAEAAGARAACRELRGAYVLVDLHASRGGVVCADPLGVATLYVAEHPEMTVVANRAGLAAWAASPGRPPGRDVGGMGWVLTLGGFVGTETCFDGVEAVPAGSFVSVDDAGRASVRRRGHPPAAAAVDPSDESVAEAARQVAADLVEAVADTARLPGPLRVGLTGGRDSRLVLAAAMAAGVEHRFTYHTTGAGGGGDVEVAAGIAASYGLAHSVSRGSGRDQGPGWLEGEVRSHAHRTCGLLPAKQLTGSAAVAPFVFVDGCYGESLRAVFGAQRPIASPGDVGAALDGRILRHDLGGLCRPEAECHYRQAAGRAAAEVAAEGVAVENVAHALFALRFSRRDVGVQDEAAPERPRAHPLVSPVAVAAAFRVGHDARRHQRLHFEVARLLHEPLARLPLVGAPWPREALAALGPAERDAYPAEGLPSSAGLAGLRGSSIAHHRPVFERLLLDDTANPVFDVVDRDRAIAAVRSAGDSPPPAETVRGLYTALGAAVWLRGGERGPGRAADRSPPHGWGA